MSTNVPLHGFTHQFNGLANVLSSPVELSEAFDPKSGDPLPKIFNFNSIWDTGASGSVITPRVVSELNLESIDEITTYTANGDRQSNVYLVNIYLPNKVAFSGVRVTDGDIFGTDVLIGMDIITCGDFAVTNVAGKTCMSFQLPSARKIDFVKDINKTRAKKGKLRRKKKRRRNRF